MVRQSASGLLSELFSTEEMDAVLSDERHVQEMLRFEWGLSAALEDCGLASPGSAASLLDLLGVPFLTPERAGQLRAAAGRAGNVAIPFVQMLTAVVAAKDDRAARTLHTGATSQDVLDTALVLQMRAAFAVLRRDLVGTRTRFIVLAREHKETVLAGRTWLQQGPPVTLGLKFAGYAAALDRHCERLREVEGRAMVLQFGGAVGTLASLRGKGLAVSSALAGRLELREPLLPWHAHRDNLAEVAAVLGLLTGTLGKIARDVSLLMQTEVAELFEPAGEGKGGSSTMPHKRNPVGCAAVLAAALRAPALVGTMLAAMPQEQERGLGGWHAEWETLPEILRLSAGALSRVREIAEGLEVDAERMSANLQLTGGLTMAESVSGTLAEAIGRPEAHRLMEAASRQAVEQDRSLKSVLGGMPGVTAHFSAQRLDELLDASAYVGSAGEMIERALAAIDREAS